MGKLVIDLRRAGTTLAKITITIGGYHTLLPQGKCKILYPRGVLLSSKSQLFCCQLQLMSL